MIATIFTTNFWPALWSAGAATFAYLLNRRIALASVRPEIVLTGWSYVDEFTSLGDNFAVDTNHAKGVELPHDAFSKYWVQSRSNAGPQAFERSGSVVVASSVENIGIGTAYDLTVTCGYSRREFEEGFIQPELKYTPYLKPKQRVHLGFETYIHWTRITPLQGMGMKHGGFDIKLEYLDLFGNKYISGYHVSVLSPPHQIGVALGSFEYAWGLMGSRKVVSVIPWWINRGAERIRKATWKTKNRYKGLKGWLGQTYAAARNRPSGGP